MAKRPTQDRKKITRTQLAERWGCSGMFIERQIRTNPDFPQYSQLGDGPMAQRTWDIEEIEAYERSRVVARSTRGRNNDLSPIQRHRRA
jgi:hypothetical protein